MPGKTVIMHVEPDVREAVKQLARELAADRRATFYASDAVRVLLDHWYATSPAAHYQGSDT